MNSILINWKIRQKSVIILENKRKTNINTRNKRLKTNAKNSLNESIDSEIDSFEANDYSIKSELTDDLIEESNSMNSLTQNDIKLSDVSSTNERLHNCPFNECQYKCLFSFNLSKHL